MFAKPTQSTEKLPYKKSTVFGIFNATMDSTTIAHPFHSTEQASWSKQWKQNKTSKSKTNFKSIKHKARATPIQVLRHIEFIERHKPRARISNCTS